MPTPSAARNDRRLEAAARTMRELAAAPGCQHHQVTWDELAPARRAFWIGRAAAVLAAAVARLDATTALRIIDRVEDDDGYRHIADVLEDGLHDTALGPYLPARAPGKEQS